MNVTSISESTFSRHTSSYLNPVLIQQWKGHQQDLFGSFIEKDDGLIQAGDGRCDSSGYSAKAWVALETKLRQVCFDNQKIRQIPVIS